MQKFFLAMALIFMSVNQLFAGQWVFVGTYTAKGSKGIYVYKFDEVTGKLDSVSSIFIENPSYLALSSSGNFLYAVSENGGDKPGEVSAFSFDKESGKLTFLNKQETKGDHPCYVSVDEENSWVAVANYTGGNLSMFPVNKDGSLAPAAQTIQHTGKSIVAGRQDAPHMHMTIFSPGEQYLVANDLGTDIVNGYKFRPSKNDQPLDTPASIRLKMKAGSGPRHLAFHPKEPLVYILEELTGTVTVHYFSKNNVSLIQEIASDTTSPMPDKGSADIHFSPDGKFLYASNRGAANYITIYSVDSEGKLRMIGSQPVLGKSPRNFAIDETGNYLLVANMNSDNIVVFKRDTATGLLTATGDQLSIPTPVCLKLMKIGQ